MKSASWNMHNSFRTMEFALDRRSPVNAIPPMHSSECTPSWCAPVEALQSMYSSRCILTSLWMHSSRGTPIYALQSMHMHSSQGTAHAHRTRAQHTGSHRNSPYTIIDNCKSRGLYSYTVLLQLQVFWQFAVLHILLRLSVLTWIFLQHPTEFGALYPASRAFI